MKRKVWIAISLALFAAGSFALCGPPFYFSPSIHGTVVDAETGKPIEGAVIVALWIPMSFNGHVDPALVTREVVTDAAGHYVVQWWGPFPSRPFTWLDYYDPKIVVFKRGYEPLEFSNVVGNNQIPVNGVSPIRHAHADGETLRLKPFRGSGQERLRSIGYVMSACDAPTGIPLNALYGELRGELQALAPESRTEVRRYLADIKSLKRER